jgi:hypothetical protein
MNISAKRDIWFQSVQEEELGKVYVAILVVKSW